MIDKVKFLFFVFIVFITSLNFANADGNIEFPSQVPALVASEQVVKSLAQEECSKTENQIPPLLKHQDAFKYYKPYFDYNAQKFLFELGFRSCTVIRGWPQKIRKALVKAATSHDNLLRYTRNNWDYHYNKTLTPNWLAVSDDTSAIMWLVGTHRVAPEEMLGQYKKLACQGLRNGGKQLSKREAIEFNTSKGYATTDGTPISHKCYESERAVENDLMVKNLWKTMDTPNKIVPSREKLLAGIKEAGAIAAYHEPILQMEERKKRKGFKKKRDEEFFE